MSPSTLSCPCVCVRVCVSVCVCVRVAMLARRLRCAQRGARPLLRITHSHLFTASLATTPPDARCNLYWPFRYTTAYNRHYTDRWHDHKKLVEKLGPLTAKRNDDRASKKRNQQRSNDMVLGVYTGLYPP